MRCCDGVACLSLSVLVSLSLSPSLSLSLSLSPSLPPNRVWLEQRQDIL